MVEHKGIHEAMVAVMSAVDPISKSKTNTGQGYRFRGIDDVYQALQAIMANHGIFTTSEVKGQPDYTEFPLGKNGTLTFRTRAVFKFTFWHTSGTSVSTEVIGEGMDSGDKASNKSMSVAHKYALLQAYLIPTEDPKDPENEDHAIPPREAPKPDPVKSKRQSVIEYLDSIKDRMTADQLAIVRHELSMARDSDDLLADVVKKADAYLAANDKATLEAFGDGGFKPE